MNRDDIIRMAQAAGHHTPYAFTLRQLETFANLVAAATRESMKVDGWRACAVGQRGTQHCGLLETAVLVEREACAQIAETAFPFHCEDLIRARGKQNGTMD